ncbi:MAG TPA: hypothetical protein ENF26_03070 [Methanomicrobia archaeon]|nr:hypothetical protein [Methanomicrobia archaeon]HEX59114.1 hypothetical protein [Methanomicrobia archaeon]
MTPLLVLAAISALFTLLGILVVYLLVGALYPKPEKPKTIDVRLLGKYGAEREVDDEDREEILKYASIGLVRVGLSGNARMTAEVTEAGRRLLG